MPLRSPDIYDHGYPPDTPGVTCAIEELRELCKEWQAVLRLQDWNVVVNFARQADMEDNDTDAQIRTFAPLHYANVRMLDPVDYDLDPPPKNDMYQHDMEQKLVHELLHLRFTMMFYKPDDQKKVNHDMFEAAIDQTAWALIGLKRRTQQRD